MDYFNELKKAYYQQKICVGTEGGIIAFDPDSLKEVVGADKMTYDEYLDVQIRSLGRTRYYFETCYFNIAIEFKGQIEKFSKDKVCFKRIFVSGMYPGGDMFDGKEDHVWMSRSGFETYNINDCLSFFAEVYRYIKTGNGKQIDYALRNPENIKKIPSYEIPADEELILQSIDQIICETCYLKGQCNHCCCMRPPQDIKRLKNQMLKMFKESNEDKK